MNLGRSEYAEFKYKAIRLKKAEKLLAETLIELKELVEQLEFEYGSGRSFHDVLSGRDDSTTILYKKIEKFFLGDGDEKKPD